MIKGVHSFSPCQQKRRAVTDQISVFEIIFIIFLALYLSFVVSGCIGLNSTDKRPKSVRQMLESGERAFMAGDYQLAESLFCQAVDESKNPWDKNRAIYNLACTKIITAQSDDEILEAMKILMQWKSSKSSPIYYENPEIIIHTLLQNNNLLKDRDSYDFKEFNAISEMHDIQEIDAIVKETNQVNTRLDRLLREQEGKIKTLNAIVKKQNEKIKLLNAIAKKESKAKEDMEAKTKELEKSIKTLKHQISELERIDQKLQNKRQSE
ncbi:MAG: hypothetical protein HQK74_09730 [Desulfamplus sp.]|nr:hypothetical protein [Desulfamplus sp.]MBF0388863.1 hypothetical protein [Desulfamplus sp.]